MTVQLELIRHGRTPLAGTLLGWVDDPLTETGWSQLHQALLEAGPWDVLISSSLRRCADFARELARQRDIPLLIEPAFRELHFGSWDGRSPMELMETEADALQRFWADPYGFTVPEGEPMTAFESRIVQALQRTYRHYRGRKALLITHAGVIRLLIARARGLSGSDLLRIEVGYAERFQLTLKASGSVEMAE